MKLFKYKVEAGDAVAPIDVYYIVITYESDVQAQKGDRIFTPNQGGQVTLNVNQRSLKNFYKVHTLLKVDEKGYRKSPKLYKEEFMAKYPDLQFTN